MKDRIFFRDKNYLLKGAFTERQVQIWYRENWFENSFPFYFMAENETPTDNSKSFTLGDLQSVNGIGCPFHWNERLESNEEDGTQSTIGAKIKKIEEDLHDVRSRIDTVLSLEQRIERVETLLNELPSETPVVLEPKQAAKAATSPKLPPIQSRDSVRSDPNPPVDPLTSLLLYKKEQEETRLFTEKIIASHKIVVAAKSWNYSPSLATEWFLRIAEAYVLSCHHGTSMEDRYPEIPNIVVFLSWLVREICDNEAEKKTCEQAFHTMLQQRTCFYCSICEVTMFNDMQAAFHLSDDGHWKNRQENDAYRGVGLIVHTVSREKSAMMIVKEVTMPLDLERKYGGIAVERNRMRPSLEFLENLEKNHSKSVFAGRGTDGGIFEAACVILKGSIGKKIMDQLHRHIGNELTYCDSCSCVSGKGKEYYRHLNSYEHLKKASRFDIPTIVANIHKSSSY